MVREVIIYDQEKERQDYAWELPEYLIEEIIKMIKKYKPPKGKGVKK